MSGSPSVLHPTGWVATVCRRYLPPAEDAARRRDGKRTRLSRDAYEALRARAQVGELAAEYEDVALSNFAQQMAAWQNAVGQRDEARERLRTHKMSCPSCRGEL